MNNEELNKRIAKTKEVLREYGMNILTDLEILKNQLVIMEALADISKEINKIQKP